MDIKKAITDNVTEGIRHYQRLHRMPELGWQETQTAAYIVSVLEEYKIAFERVAGTGIIATIQGEKPGHTLGLRADIDGLPITEKTGLPFASRQEGRMHACGHDGHSSALLVTGKILQECRRDLHGTVKLIFQPSEEYLPSGARIICETGKCDDCDIIAGLHLRSDIPLGKIVSEPGECMAASAGISILITGQVAHAATPELGVDATVAAAAVLLNLQTAVSRELSIAESAILTIGKMESGIAKNIISGQAKLEGTLRYYQPEVETRLAESIERICIRTAQAYGACAKVTVERACAPVINDSRLAAIGKQAIIKMYGKETLYLYPKSGLNEDFSEYASICPVMYFLVGAASKNSAENFPHHSERFQIKEESIEYAIGTYLAFALEYLNDEEEAL